MTTDTAATVDREDYPSIEAESPFGLVKIVIQPENVLVRATEDRPITINRIAYYGDIWLEQRPEGYRIRHSYMRRVGGGWASEPTNNAASAIYRQIPEMVKALLADSPALLVEMRRAEIANAINSRQVTIANHEMEARRLREEIAALEQEQPGTGRPYMASYRHKGHSMYSEPERIEFRAANDIEAAQRARELAPVGAERFSIHSLPAAGLQSVGRDLGPSYWISDED